ncbi:MAG: hypothetical protein U0W24_22685 [Bacteroidales bacterium]
MKIRLITSFLFLIQFNTTFAQVDEDLIKLEHLFDQEKYDEMIKYKARKTRKLSAKSLFYKGLAFFSKNDDLNANAYFDMAIKKGPADEAMYFYRGFSFFYLERYRKAIADFNHATSEDNKSIAFSLIGESYLRLGKEDSSIFFLEKAIRIEDCAPQSFITLGSVYQEQEKYDSALSVLKTAFSKLNPTDELHKVCSYNIGLILQITDKDKEAIEKFNEHLNYYKDDYQAISRLIQLYYKTNETQKAGDLKKYLYDAHRNNLLSEDINQMFCFDQFKWNEKQVLAFENYNEYDEPGFVCKHKFFILNKKGEVDFIIRTEKDTFSLGNDSIFAIKMIKDDTLSVYNGYYYLLDEFDYFKLKEAVFQILDNKVVPIYKAGEYSKLSLAKRNIHMQKNMGDRDGSSFEKAIVVKSISEEYEWIGANYPGYKFIQQSLVFDKKNPYDVLEIKTLDGATLKIYFDISSFFGKGF